jgi:ADP-ribose pyrophosphatase YjhB (NUDIX family)
VQHARTKYVALPGGHLEWGEDLQECLSREIFEELGIKPKIGKLSYVNMFIEEKDNKHYIEFFFEVLNGEDYLNIEKLASSHSHELINIVWASPTDNLDILPKELAKDFKEGKMISSEVRYIKD